MIRRILSAVLALLFAATVADAMTVKAGSEDVKTYFCLRLAATGVAIAAPTITDIDLYYTRSGAAQAAKVDATALAAADSAHADNKAFAVGQGVLRVDWPDAAFAAGVREVILTVVYATAFTENLRVDLTPAAVDVVTIEGGDATDTIRDSVVDDTTRIDASALNTLSGHDPGEAIMGATDLGTGSGFTAIPWNAAWDAEVESEATDALNAYDPPTNAEMEARTLTAALYATAATQATNTTHLTDIKGTGFVKDTHSLPQCLTATGFSTLDAAGVATAVWNAATATYGTAGSYGLLVETDLDATLSSRLAPAGTLARCTLVDTTTANTDMRGTNDAELAGAAAAATIYTEIKRGTAATVLCKPVSRSLYFLSTYIGVRGD